MLRLTEEQLAARAKKLDALKQSKVAAKPAIKQKKVYRMANGSTIDVVDSGDEKLVSVPLGKKAKQKKVAVPTEHEEQSKVIAWADTHKIAKHLFAIPNGSYKSPAMAAKFKREGLRSGVPDLFLPFPLEGGSGLFIEMKRTNGSVTSEAQVDWMTYLQGEGYTVVICKGADEAIKTIKRYLGEE